MTNCQYCGEEYPDTAPVEFEGLDFCSYLEASAYFEETSSDVIAEQLGIPDGQVDLLKYHLRVVVDVVMGRI